MAIILLNIVVDVLYAAVDPRVAVAGPGRRSALGRLV
jgi:hypothetical protein